MDKRIIIASVLVIVICSVAYYFFFAQQSVTIKKATLEEILKNVKSRLIVESPYFANKSFIPATFTCSGKNIPPKLILKNIPSGTKSFVLIMYDPDAPMGTFYHWIKYNIPYEIHIIENDTIGTNIINSFGHKKYGGPCPPPGEKHRYYFVIIALDKVLDSSKIKNYKDLLNKINGHVLAYGCIMGLYKR